jgi:hypothetical protein
MKRLGNHRQQDLDREEEGKKDCALHDTVPPAHYTRAAHCHESVFVADYSCALVGDILLQGHLYITKNYFAFYSNVFGYVTKVRNKFSIFSSGRKRKS